MSEPRPAPATRHCSGVVLRDAVAAYDLLYQRHGVLVGAAAEQTAQMFRQRH